jgi:dihydrolipoamide dehydrogenase
MSDVYDIVIIGSGPGGYVAAIRAGQLGLKTAIVEKEHLGGTCLNVGCIPTKVLLRSAEVLTLAREGKEFGVLADGVRLDLPTVIARKEKIVQERRKGVEALMAKNKATVYTGAGSIIGAGKVRVQGKDGAQVVEGRNIIIATGSAPKSLPFATIDEKTIISSTGALLLTDLPVHVAIIGAGAIGVEFASLLQEFGSKVTLIEALPQILPLEDKDAAAEVARAFRSRGIRMMTAAKVGSVTPSANGVTLQVTGSDGATEDIVADKLLMAVGRRPVTEGAGLETVGVKTDRGFVVVDGNMRSNVQGIYAIGDCITVAGQGAHLQLAHVASAEGILAVETIAGHTVKPLDYNAIPRAVYSHPEVASIGLTEEQATQQGYQLKIGKFPMRASSKSGILGERGGMVKLVTDAKYGEILGMSMVGPMATEIIAEIAVAKRLEATVEEIAQTVHAHPTVAEAVMEAAHAALGGAIHF